MGFDKIQNLVDFERSNFIIHCFTIDYLGLQRIIKD